MNDRDRSAWAKALGSALLPSPTGESGLIVIPGRGPSKANTYEVRIDPTLWQQIKPIVEQWRKQTGKRPFWISPSDAVKVYEQLVAYHVTASEKFKFEGPLSLDVALYGQRIDIDNSLKAAIDGIQLSGVIKN